MAKATTYNKVLIGFNCYNSCGRQRRLTLNYIVDASIGVGDRVNCQFKQAWREGVVLSIGSSNVKQLDTHKKVELIDRKDQLTDYTSTNQEEEIVMVNKLFAVVKVRHENGYVNFVKVPDKSCDIVLDSLIIYALDKTFTTNRHVSKYHIGVAVEVYPAGTPFNDCITGWFIGYVPKHDLDGYIRMEKEYNKLYTQLEARRKAFEKEAIYLVLAEKDPIAKEILDDINKLKGGTN